jgi:hypothetical protein
MITIDLAQLSNVIGGACLQPGATADSRSPIIDRCDPTIGLRPGATPETRNPVRKIQPFVLGLRPGQTA